MAYNPANVLAAYDFDGNGNDESGNGNHLPDTSGTAPSYGTDGVQGSYVTLAANTWLGKTGGASAWHLGTDDYSAFFWVFITQNNAFEPLAANGAFSNGDEGYNLQIRTTLGGDGQSRPYVDDGLSTDTHATANAGLNYGAWNHVGWNIKQGGNVDFFVNGVLQTSVAYGFTGEDIGSDGDFFHIGGDGIIGFIGNMAQAIFKKGGVSSQEDIDAMFNGGVRLTYDELIDGGSGAAGSGSGEFGSGSGEIGSGSGTFGSGSGEPGSGSGAFGSGSGEPGSGSGTFGSGSGEPEPCETSIGTASQAVKLETLKNFIAGILAEHANGGTWRVDELVSQHLLGMESRFDFQDVFGKPIRWCRIAPVDQPDAVDNVDDLRDVMNSTVLVTHEYEIILQYQFEESNVFAGSTTEEWYDVLWGRCPDGILTALNYIGALEVDDGSGDIIQVNKPNTLAMPSMPLVAYGSNLSGDGEQLLIHHADFRVQLT